MTKTFNPVVSKDELISRLLEQKDQIKSMGVCRLALFGSISRDELTDSSDVDFYIELEATKQTFRNFNLIYDFLEAITGRPIDVVTPDSLNKYIGPHILRSLEEVPIAA
ncbi:MAG: nucleotidyltransferase domain-containing protein [Bacteroidia bacterium]|nr:nucleotidyltransferase domain-containing protein [Bacteroidia bacterium]